LSPSRPRRRDERRRDATRRRWRVRLLISPTPGARFSLAVLSWDVDNQRLILVVEDDEATRKFLLDNLAADGFRVAGASSAGEGLRAIEVRQPNLVVLDLALEDSSGLDLLDRLRAADGLASRLDPDLPVIVLTGRAGEADRVRSFARGADDHVLKLPVHCLRASENDRGCAVLHRAGQPVVGPSGGRARLSSFGWWGCG
jgi:CheY-like chemotaxis protein